jgi:hypothetical protein
MYRQKYFPFLSVFSYKLPETSFEKVYFMTKMSPAVMLATLLFFGASVFAEEATPAPGSQSADVTTDNKVSKQQTPGKKHLRHYHKGNKGTAGSKSTTPQK